MEAFALYLLKSVIWLSGFALVYILFLRNERFFLLNRLYLISGILTSFFFPLISVHYTVVLPLLNNTQADNSIVSGIQNVSYNNTPDPGLLLLTLYLSGVLFVTLMIIKQSKSVLKSIKKAEIITSHPIKLIRTAEYSSSFSFFSYVFVNPSITDVETKEIVNHELVHIRQRHWLDLVLVELLCVLQWFNPLIWIYIRFIRQNHEYLADEVALQRTSDPAVYRAVLLNQIVGAPVVRLANSFNYSLNKKRFYMMKNIIRSPYRKMKVLFVLPLFAIVFYAFAIPEYHYSTPSDNSMAIYQSKAIISREVKGVVLRQDGQPLPGATIIVTGTTLGVSSDAKGYFKLGNVPDEVMLAVSYVGFKTRVIKPDFVSEMTITMIRDTIKYSKANISAPPPPPPSAFQEYNEIKSKKGTLPLVLIDGKVTDIDVNIIDLKKVETISVLKDKSATAVFGEKGKDGVIVITTKKKAAENEDKIEIRNTDGSQVKPLIVIDGVVNEKTGLNEIDPNQISSMKIMKDKSATAQYGEKGKNGVIEITTKKNDSLLNTKMSDVRVTGYGGVQKVQKETMVVVETLPEFPGGGNEAMVAWILKTLKYPTEAVKGKITGKVYVDFTVTSSGKVKNVIVSKPGHPLLDAEAKRVISNMPDWKPGSQAGKPVDVQMMVPVEFKLH